MAADLRKMAAHSKQSKCGPCNKNVTKTSKALLCVGNCKSWLHNTCIDASDEEYELFKALKGKAVYTCGKCRAPVSARAEPSCLLKVHDVEKDNGLCPDYLKLLTDQISDLIEQYNVINAQLIKMDDDRKLLRSAVNNQAEVMNALLINNGSSTGAKTYSDTLKVK